MIVVDASALAEHVLCEEGWDRASRYLKERRPLYSVDHVLKELLTYDKRQAEVARPLNITV